MNDFYTYTITVGTLSVIVYIQKSISLIIFFYKACRDFLINLKTKFDHYHQERKVTSTIIKVLYPTLNIMDDSTNDIIMIKCEMI